jgi:NhaP-type Na+/H+ and K+/H+ antiporter
MKTFTTPLAVLSIFCFVMSFMMLSASTNIAIPASLAFTTMGMLAGLTAAGLRQVNKKLDKLGSTESKSEILDNDQENR